MVLAVDTAIRLPEEVKTEADDTEYQIVSAAALETTVFFDALETLSHLEEQQEAEVGSKSGDALQVFGSTVRIHSSTASQMTEWGELTSDSTQSLQDTFWEAHPDYWSWSSKLDRDVEERFFAIRDFDENWDGYGAKPIEEMAFRRAHYILTLSEKENGPSMPNSFIVPLANGGLQLEWKLNDGRELIIEVPPSLAIGFLVDTKDEDGEIVEQEGKVPEDAYLLEVFRRFLSR